MKDKVKLLKKSIFPPFTDSDVLPGYKDRQFRVYRATDLSINDEVLENCQFPNEKWSILKLEGIKEPNKRRSDVGAAPVIAKELAAAIEGNLFLDLSKNHFGLENFDKILKLRDELVKLTNLHQIIISVFGNDFCLDNQEQITHYKPKVAGIYWEHNAPIPYVPLDTRVHQNSNVYDQKEPNQQQNENINKEESAPQDYSEKIETLSKINSLIHVGRTIHTGWKTYKDPSKENWLNFGMYMLQTTAITVNYVVASNSWWLNVAGPLMWIPIAYNMYEFGYKLYKCYFADEASSCAAILPHLVSFSLSSGLSLIMGQVKKAGAWNHNIRLAFTVINAAFFIGELLADNLLDNSKILDHGDRSDTKLDEITIARQSDFVPLEDTVKKVNLCNITQDYMHNLPGFADNMIEQLDDTCFNSDLNNDVNGCEHTSINSTDTAGVIVEVTYSFLDADGNC